MADVTSNSGAPRFSRGKVKTRKMSTRIDFTPMVDLGFLLITFFMLTTSMSKPKIMALVMPVRDTVAREPVKESKVLTLLPGKNNKVYYYEGISNAKLDSTMYSAPGLRTVLLEKMRKVREQFGEETFVDSKSGDTRHGSFLYVLIKPTRDATYKNLVDILDELAITQVRYYAIVDPTEAEIAFLKNPWAGL